MSFRAASSFGQSIRTTSTASVAGPMGCSTPSQRLWTAASKRPPSITRPPALQQQQPLLTREVQQHQQRPQQQLVQPQQHQTEVDIRSVEQHPELNQVIDLIFDWLQLTLSQSYQTFFFIKRRFFLLLLSLSVCSMRKYCLYFEMAKLNNENLKNEEIKVW